MLQDTTFTVSALGYEIGIPVISVGEDEFGEFVLVEPQKRQLGDGWTFELQLCARSQDEVPGSELSIQQFSDEVADLATQQGIDLNKVLLVNPPRAGFSIGFNWAGHTNGKGLISKVTDYHGLVHLRQHGPMWRKLLTKHALSAFDAYYLGMCGIYDNGIIEVECVDPCKVTCSSGTGRAMGNDVDCASRARQQWVVLLPRLGQGNLHCFGCTDSVSFSLSQTLMSVSVDTPCLRAQSVSFLASPGSNAVRKRRRCMFTSKSASLVKSQ